MNIYIFFRIWLDLYTGRFVKHEEMFKMRYYRCKINTFHKTRIQNDFDKNEVANPSQYSRWATSICSSINKTHVISAFSLFVKSKLSIRLNRDWHSRTRNCIIEARFLHTISSFFLYNNRMIFVSFLSW